jgi:hypothetical protein
MLPGARPWKYPLSIPETVLQVSQRIDVQNHSGITITMKTLLKACGIAVLLLALFFVRVIYNFSTRGHDHNDEALVWVSVVGMAGLDLLAFVGAYLLVTKTR